MKFEAHELEQFRHVMAGMSGANPPDAAHIPLLIAMLERKQRDIVSTNDAVNDILRSPRRQPGAGPAAGGYNDLGPGGYSEWIEDSGRSGAGYNDAGYNDHQEPLPGGGYHDYTEWIDHGLQRPGGEYNDGPQDERSLARMRELVRSGPLLDQLRDRRLLTTFQAAVRAAGLWGP